MRKPDFCIRENNGVDQLCGNCTDQLCGYSTADQPLSLRFIDNTKILLSKA